MGQAGHVGAWVGSIGRYKTQNIALGKEMVFDALKQYKLKSVNFEQVAKYFNTPDEATFFNFNP